MVDVDDDNSSVQGFSPASPDKVQRLKVVVLGDGTSGKVGTK